MSESEPEASCSFQNLSLVVDFWYVVAVAAWAETPNVGDENPGFMTVSCKIIDKNQYLMNIRNGLLQK